MAVTSLVWEGLQGVSQGKPLFPAAYSFLCRSLLLLSYALVNKGDTPNKEKCGLINTLPLIVVQTFPLTTLHFVLQQPYNIDKLIEMF